MPTVRDTAWSDDHIPIPELSPAEMHRFHSKVRRGEECWEWTGEKSPKGYGRFAIFRRGRLRILAHRVAYLIATGNDPGAQIVRHTCDNPPCCRPDHLLTGTPADNTRDALERGRMKLDSLAGHQRARMAKAIAKVRSGVKHCNCCDQTKSREDFYRRRASFDGLSDYCKTCSVAQRRHYRELERQRIKEMA